MIVRTLVTIQLGRVMRPAGSELDVVDVEGARLVATKAAERVSDSVGELSPEQAAFVALKAAEAVEFVATVPTLDLLSRLAVTEERRKGGPRKTVAEAFAARGAALLAATSQNTPPSTEG